jgi:cell division protein FtsB
MSKWGIAILVVVLVLLQVRLWFGDRSLSEIASLKEQIEVKSVENATQVRINKELQGKVNDLMSESESVEEISRSELMLVKPGEVFVVIPTE